MKDGRPLLSSVQGFTIVEMAIVMIIVGILLSLGITMVGSLAKTAKFNETQGTIEADLESLIGFAATNKRLPANANFAAAAKKANDAWGNPLYYIVDTGLSPSAPYTSPDYICPRRSTGLTVRNCLNNACTAATDYVDIPNIAFLVISGGENFNLQTAAAVGRVTVYIRHGATARDDCTLAGNCPNYTGTMINQSERYDDIVRWVTLDELRIKAGCQGGQLKILNNELPSGTIAGYSADIYASEGIPFTTRPNTYRWCVNTVPTTGLQVSTGLTAADCMTTTNWSAASPSDRLTIAKSALPLTANSYQ
ncbi:MAG: type II secretion system protein, partial [Syntrophorhabdus sp.]